VEKRILRRTAKTPHALLCNYRNCRGGRFWLVDELDEAMHPAQDTTRANPRCRVFQRLREWD
jgi:hypothetical protein